MAPSFAPPATSTVPSFNRRTPGPKRRYRRLGSSTLNASEGSKQITEPCSSRVLSPPNQSSLPLMAPITLEYFGTRTEEDLRTFAASASTVVTSATIGRVGSFRTRRYRLPPRGKVRRAPDHGSLEKPLVLGSNSPVAFSPVRKMRPEGRANASRKAPVGGGRMRGSKSR